MGDAAPLAVVDGDQVARGQEEVGVVGVEGVLGRLEVDAVEHHVEHLAVGLHLGMRRPLQRVVDRQLVDAEHLAQHLTVFGRRLDDVGPDHRLGGLTQPRGIDRSHLAGAAIAMDEVADHGDRDCGPGSRVSGRRRRSR